MSDTWKSERWEGELDRALDELARAEKAARPEPGDALVARVLADAANAGAGGRPAPVRDASTGGTGRQTRRAGGLVLALAGLGFGPQIAAAALVLSLAAGFGIGYSGSAEAVVRSPVDWTGAEQARDPLSTMALDEFDASALF